ncbi:hypothetical protein HAX54_003144, partial [Datura stramonium]|nr:hypothetical protein [Datura stramonium]
MSGVASSFPLVAHAIALGRVRSQSRVREPGSAIAQAGAGSRRGQAMRTGAIAWMGVQSSKGSVRWLGERLRKGCTNVKASFSVLITSNPQKKVPDTDEDDGRSRQNIRPYYK